jgi:hypothetical protein
MTAVLSGQFLNRLRSFALVAAAEEFESKYLRAQGRHLHWAASDGSIPAPPMKQQGNFYTKLGFELLGSARNYAPGQTMDNSDIVLKLPLAACLEH